MEVSYNVRYQKSNFFSKLLTEIEGEIVIYKKGFRLKGKGAGDKGELINFSEIKEFYYKNDKVYFITFSREKYIISDVGTQFDQMLLDLYKSRNEFLVDALFMKVGKCLAEFETNFERLSKFGKTISRGRGKVKIYEGSLVLIPPDQDAFSANFSFVKDYVFDELDYSLKIILDDEQKILMSQLGNEYDVFKEKVDQAMGTMYQTVINDVLKTALPYQSAQNLLQIAYKIKGGKPMSAKEIKKVDEELYSQLKEYFYQDPELANRIQTLINEFGEDNFYFSLAEDKASEKNIVKWFMLVLPEQNVAAFMVCPRWQEGDKTPNYTLLFFKIIAEKGDPLLKSDDKIREITQAMIALNFAKDPCYKHKKELRYSPYQYAIRKMPFLRILRKSFAGKAANTEQDNWLKEVKQIIENSRLK
jgi:hypothetical protein